MISVILGSGNCPKLLSARAPLPRSLPPFLDCFAKGKQENEKEKPIDWESLEDSFDFIRGARDEMHQTNIYISFRPTPSGMPNIRLGSALSQPLDLSLRGLTHVRPGGVDFIPLEEWLRANHLFSRVMSIAFFVVNDSGACFRLLRRAVQCEKMTNAQESLTMALFSRLLFCKSFISFNK
jgi:hypothetical protein